MMPMFQHKSFIQLVADIIITRSRQSSSSDVYMNNNIYINQKQSESVDFGLNTFQKLYEKLIILYLWTFRFTIMRVYHQYVIYISMWLMENFPFLAYYMFGRANSHVKAL